MSLEALLTISPFSHLLHPPILMPILHPPSLNNVLPHLPLEPAPLHLLQPFQTEQAQTTTRRRNHRKNKNRGQSQSSITAISERCPETRRPSRLLNIRTETTRRIYPRWRSQPSPCGLRTPQQHQRPRPSSHGRCTKPSTAGPPALAKKNGHTQRSRKGPIKQDREDSPHGALPSLQIAMDKSQR